MSGSAAAWDTHAGQPRGPLRALSPRHPGGCAGGGQGAPPGTPRPEQQGLRGAGRGIFGPPAAPACLGCQMQAGRGRRGAGAEQRTNSRSNGEGRGRKRRWRGGEEGCPPRGRRIALYPPSFPPSHTPTAEAASHQDIYEHTHKWEGEGRQEKKQKTPPPTTQPYFAHSLSSKSRCAVACKPRRTLPCC